MSSSGIILAGRYQLEGRIAAGAVGEVWRATDLVLSRPVAVKRLRDGYAGQPEAMERFRAEARHAGALSHPGIAQVYDYGEAEPPSPPFLVMEFVDGPSLAGLLDGGPLDPADAMDVLAQVAAGLAAAHAAGLVHRDIKPANLLVAGDGQVKITDFGIAHAAGSAQLTRTGTMVGTPSYLAPERAGGASATAASDLYSLGVVGYECLAGQPPFQGTPMEVVAACQRAPMPPLPAAVPAGVAALVMDLTAKDPAARPASASQVATRAARLRDALRDSRAATLAAGPAPVAQSPVAQPAAGPVPLPAGPLPAGPLSGEPLPAGALPAGALPAGALPAGPGATATIAALPPLGDPATGWPLDAGTGWPAEPGTGWPPEPGTGWPADPATGWPPELGQDGPAGPRRGWPWWAVPLGAALAVLVAATGWLVLSSSGSTPAAAPQPTATHPATVASTVASTPAVRTVDVNAAALAGLPVRVVRQRLARLGLRPQLAGELTFRQPPGTVLSVQPSGPVTVGSVVTVLVARRLAGQHHREHGGNGQGGQHGGGGNGNGGD
jgi:tRNA A-37 threonylcarbamoyl transferase component Bud32